MTANSLVELSQRKNAAHKELLRVKAQVRQPAGTNKMTEADRNIDMDFRTREQIEAWENLCDQYTVRMAEYGKHV